VLALVATSYALNASKIPFAAPIAGVRVGRIQGKWVLNPTFQQLAYSDMELVVSASNDSIVMVEGGALEVSETDVLDALGVAHKGIRELIAAQEELMAKAGRQPTMEWTRPCRRGRGHTREGAGGRTHQRSVEPEGQAHAYRRGRAGEEGDRRGAPVGFPR
jgi:polyribonucleotide nucleotidyltransferase